MGLYTASVVCLLFLFLKVGYGAIDVGKYLKTCDRNSPDVNDCLVDAIQSGLDTMAGGIQEWQVPAIDPYRQKELKIEYNRNQIWVRMVMKDIHVMGLKDSTVKDARLKVDDESFHLEVDMFTPVVRTNGNYRAEGRYNALQIIAEGTFNGTMTDLVYTWKLDGKLDTKDNETYIRIHSFYMRPDVGDMKSYLTNDNPDSKSFTDLGNRFANDNWRPLYQELLPYAQANWNKIGTRVANKLFQKIPYDEIFPARS